MKSFLLPYGGSSSPGTPKTAPEPFLGERKPPAASHKAAPVAHGNSSQSQVMQQPF